jgi:putative transposase
VGSNPADRAKTGVKRSSLLVEADGGVPLAVVVAGANVRDDELLEATLDVVVVQRPEPTEEAPQHLCLDKGYDKPSRRELVEGRDYVPHIWGIGEEKLDEAGEKRSPARRWVVERALGWLSKRRSILVRYEKKASSYPGMIKMACILLWYCRQHRLLESLSGKHDSQRAEAPFLVAASVPLLLYLRTGNHPDTRHTSLA